MCRLGRWVLERERERYWCWCWCWGHGWISQEVCVYEELKGKEKSTICRHEEKKARFEMRMPRQRIKVGVCFRRHLCPYMHKRLVVVIYIRPISSHFIPPLHSLTKSELPSTKRNNNASTPRKMQFYPIPPPHRLASPHLTSPQVTPKSPQPHPPKQHHNRGKKPQPNLPPDPRLLRHAQHAIHRAPKFIPRVLKLVIHFFR